MSFRSYGSCIYILYSTFIRQSSISHYISLVLFRSYGSWICIFETLHFSLFASNKLSIFPFKSFCLWRLLKMELERVVPTIFYLNNVIGNVLKKKQNKHQNRMFWKYKVILFWFISWKHHLKIVSVLWQYAMHIHIVSQCTHIQL